MSDNQSRRPTAKLLILVVLIAIVISVVSTLIQHLLMGKSNVAVTGGVVGALTAGLAINIIKKKPSQ